MKPYIKICGVTNDQDLKELIKLDIDAIGFNRDKDSPYFIEVNSNPGLMGIEKTFSKDFSITEEILKTYMDRTNWS